MVLTIRQGLQHGRDQEGDMPGPQSHRRRGPHQDRILRLVERHIAAEGLGTGGGKLCRLGAFRGVPRRPQTRRSHWQMAEQPETCGCEMGTEPRGQSGRCPWRWLRCPTRCTGAAGLAARKPAKARGARPSRVKSVGADAMALAAIGKAYGGAGQNHGLGARCQAFGSKVRQALQMRKGGLGCVDTWHLTRAWRTRPSRPETPSST